MMCLFTREYKNDLTGFSHIPKSPLSLRSKKRVEERALAICRKQISKVGQKMVTSRCQHETCVSISKGLPLKVRGERVRKETVVGTVRKDSCVGWKHDCLQSVVLFFRNQCYV